MSSTVRTEQLRVRLGLTRRLVLPAWVIETGEDGPALLLTAAQHGNEVQGSEVIRRFVTLAERNIVRGRVLAVPFVNLPAIQERRPHVGMQPGQPYEQDGGLNMNRCWPGRADGSPMERITRAVYDAFGETATHVLDLHCWQKHAAPGILLHDGPGMRELAVRIGQRFVHIRPHSAKTLAGYFGETGRMGLTYEMAGQYTLNECQIDRGVRVVVNFARAIGLLPGEPEAIDDHVLFSDEVRSRTVRTHAAGLFVKSDLDLCQAVQEGTSLGEILGDRDLGFREIGAPVGGHLQSHGVTRANCDVLITGHHPYVTKGEQVAVIWE
jgi:predicted deacylase